MCQPQHRQSSLLSQDSSRRISKPNFRAIEAKWSQQWAARHVEMPKVEYGSQHVYHPVAPLYRRHVQNLKLLSGLNNDQDPILIPDTDSGTILAGVLELTKPMDPKAWSDLEERGGDLQSAIEVYGTDITRTCMIFRGQEWTRTCTRKEISQTQRWFKRIWRAVLLAHDSYMFSQTATPAMPDIPAAFYEPKLDSWEDYSTDEPRSWVHIPPSEPEIRDSSMGRADDKLWLAAQEALLAYRQPMSASTLEKTQSGLYTLTQEMITYDNAREIQPGVIYHAGRILLSMLAPFAPAYAEECWVMLHYGDPQSPSEDDPSEGMDGWEIEEDLAEDDELQHLPRRGRPETLPSIFNQPPPVAASMDEIELLRERSK